MPTRFYYWIVAHGDDGKPYLISAAMCHSEEEARQRGIEMLSGINFEIKRFPTRDLSTASSLLRGERLEGSHSLRDSARRQGHEKSLKYLRHTKKRKYNQ